MALIKCPECGKEISDKSEKCINCGYPLKEISTHKSPKSQKNFIILLLSIIILLCITLALLFTNGSQTSKTEAETTLSPSPIVQTNTTSDLISQTRKNLSPYYDLLGQDASDGSIEVSQEFIDSLSSVTIMGYTGTLSHGYEYTDKLFVGIMDWKLNEPTTKEDFSEFIVAMNSFFDYTATIESYDSISEETYLWVDFANLCMVCGWYDNGTIYLRWDLEESRVKAIQTNNTKNNSTPTPSPRTNTSSCLECGEDAIYLYTNPFSNIDEPYCYSHYWEILQIMSDMESDVGSSSYSKNTCEECNREGTHTYYSFTGQTEYYCTTHYAELQDMLESFGLN